MNCGLCKVKLTKIFAKDKWHVNCRKAESVEA